MNWPYKTTVRFKNDHGREIRLTYAISAGDMIEAKCELERRFLSQEVFGYTIERIVAATKEEAAKFNLPAGCVVLLGY
jgi:hypothetical protein